MKLPEWLTQLFSREPAKTESMPHYMSDPKLSCFVRGLIRSMDETPEEWVIDYFPIESYMNGKVDVFSTGGVFINDARQEVTTYEKEILIKSTRKFKTRFRDPLKKEYDSIRTPFERLGCPDS